MTTITRPHHAAIRTPYVVALVWSSALAVLAWATHDGDPYRWALIVSLALAGGYIARIDMQTMKLPNRLTAPLAAGAALQVLTVSALRGTGAPLVAGTAATAIVGATYLALGLAGWVGFGDVKFATGLTLTATITTGIAAVYTAPAALLISATSRLVLQCRRHAPQPHGPALLIAAVIMMVMNH